MNTPRKYATGKTMRCAALMATLAMLMSSCGVSVASGTTETEATICRELASELPSYSLADTIETKRQGVRFLTAFKAICPYD